MKPFLVAAVIVAVVASGCATAPRLAPSEARLRRRHQFPPRFHLSALPRPRR